MAEISGGTVTAIGPGTAVITVSTEDGKLSASCEVTVFLSDVSNDEEIIGDDSFEIPDGIWVAGFAESVTYSGSRITQPDMRVYCGTTLLRAGSDYTVSYRNNVNVGEATLTIQGKGKFTGKASRTFRIEPITLFADDKDEIDIAVGCVNKGKPIKPVVTVTHEGKVLKQDKDYTLEYDEINSQGSVYVIIRGCGNYQGFADEEFVVKEAGSPNISKASVVGLKKSYTYDELSEENIEEVLSGISLVYNKEQVPEDEYDLKLENADAVGKGTLVITPSKDGRFSVSKRVTFNITGNKLGSIVLSETAFYYNGTRQVPEISVYSGKKGEGDYIDQDCYLVSLSSDSVKSGTVTVTVTGKASKGYTGKLTARYTIKPLPIDTAISSGTIRVTPPKAVTYAQGGAVFTPLVTFTDGSGRMWTLKEGDDYTVKFTNNKSAAGTRQPFFVITGKGSFSGKSDGFSFDINKRDITSLPVSCSDVAVNYARKGSYYYSKPVITDVNGKALKEKTDYTVSYAKASGSPIGKDEILREGTAIKATITATGTNYTGTTTVVYHVTRKLQNIAKATASKIGNRMYTGSPVEIDSDDDDFRLFYATGSGTKKELEEGKDFVITGYYNNISKGTASMRVEGRGEYCGSKIITFKIVASSVSSADVWKQVF